MILIQKCIEARFCLRSRIKKLFFSTPLWHFFDNPLCKNQKIRAIRSTRKNIKKRHKKHREKIRNLASETILTQGFFSSERKGQKEKSKNSAVSRKSRKGKFLQVSLLKNAKWVCEGTGHISSLFYLVNQTEEKEDIADLKYDADKILWYSKI